MVTFLRLLGEFEIRIGDSATPVAIPNGRASTLLKLLAMRRNRVVAIEAIMDALWPDELPDAAIPIVSSLVSRLRRAIGDDLRRLEGGYRLDTTGWAVDLDEAIDLIRTGRRRLDAGEPALADAAARRAVDLLSFDLLAGSPATDWVVRARVEHESLVQRARHLAWRTADALGDHDRAKALAEAAIAADRLDEAAHRALMLAHYRSGARALALRAYTRLAEELEEQLGSSPDPLTDRLHVAILRGAAIGGRKAAPPGPFRARSPRPLVGRDEVLDRTEALWRDAAGGVAQSLLLRGAPGSGRTAILTEMVLHARTTGGAVLASACSESTRRLPLHPIATALRSYCATAHPALVQGYLAGIEDVAAQLIPELGESAPARRTPAVRSILQHARLVEAVVQFVARLAAEHPVLIAIDDVVRADRLTASALTVMRERLAGLPVAMVATADLDSLPPPFTIDSTLRLTPLSRTATAQLAERLHLGRLANLVHTLTAGHPRFVVEAFRAARQGISLTGELPHPLVAAALDRIERSGPEMVDALTLVAALGPRFTGAQASRVLPAGGVAILRRAVTAGLLVVDGDRLAFESELLRAAVCTATPTPLRPVLGLDARACLPAVAAAA